MHNPAAEGNAFFVCDCCMQHWDEDRPMVEGHQGSLICSQCLTVGYGSLVHLHEGGEHAGNKCVMCIEHRSEPLWQSPLRPEIFVCVRCIRQAAGTLSADPDFGWKRPEKPAGLTKESLTLHADEEEDLDQERV
jgi:hypothetical protein